MSNRKDKRINNSEPLKVWIWSLLGVFVFCLFSYVYLVRGAIVNIVARQTMETNLAVLSSKVSDLETQYIKAKNNVTPELAQSLGFIAVSDANQKFVTRDTKVSGLSVLTPGL
ncbi:MAG: hypothetical protein WCP24_00525 [bacterium]